MRSGDTPVPIPNTTVKTWAADDTILVTVWQNRWLPDLNKIIPYNVRNCMKYNFSAGGCVFYNCGSHEVWRHAERRWDRKRFRKEPGKMLFLPNDCSVSQNKRSSRQSLPHIWVPQMIIEFLSACIRCEHLRSQRKIRYSLDKLFLENCTLNIRWNIKTSEGYWLNINNLRLKPSGFYRPCFRDEANYRTWIR